MSSIELDSQFSDDETSITEISFLPDGRVCLFGASQEIVELFWRLDFGDESLRARHLSIQAAVNRLSPTRGSDTWPHVDEMDPKHDR